MPGHKNKKKEAGKIGPGGKNPKGGKPETGQDVMNKAEKATPLDPNVADRCEPYDTCDDSWILTIPPTTVYLHKGEQSLVQLWSITDKEVAWR